MDDPPVILVLDENVESLEAMRQFLNEQGYRVFCATDAERGLEMAQRLKPRLVIADMLLPGGSAFRVVERIKSWPNLSTSIVMMSQFGGAPQSRLAQFLGAEEFIHKPISLNRLMESVTRYCPLPAGARRQATAGPHLLDKLGVHGGA